MPHLNGGRIGAALPPLNGGRIGAALPPLNGGRIGAALPPLNGGRIGAALPPLNTNRIIAVMPSRESIERQLLARDKPARWGSRTILPDYAGYSIANLPSWIERLFGLDGPKSPLTQIASALPPSEHVVLLILDGLGYRKAESLFERFPDLVLRSLGEGGLYFPLTSVFPSTTVAALASIGTGLTPLEHGLVGYRLYLRETSAITNMVRFAMVGNAKSDAAFAAGLGAETLVPSPTVQERLANRGVDVHTLLPQYIAASGLSRALYRGSRQLHAVAGLSDMLVAARQLLHRATTTTFLSLYWPGLDAIAHIRGPESEAYVAEMRAIDDAIRRELVGRVNNTLLVVTSDHGFVPMRPDDYVRLRDTGDVEEALLLPPVGEPRASYLYVREGTMESVSRSLDRRLEDGLVCVDSGTLIEDRLLGEGTPHPEITARIGDLAVVATGSGGIYHPYHDAVLLRGMHGGLTEDEMLVPLIASPL